MMEAPARAFDNEELTEVIVNLYNAVVLNAGDIEELQKKVRKLERRLPVRVRKVQRKEPPFGEKSAQK